MAFIDDTVWCSVKLSVVLVCFLSEGERKILPYTTLMVCRRDTKARPCPEEEDIGARRDRLRRQEVNIRTCEFG